MIKKFIFTVTVVITFSFLGFNQIQAQSEKKSLDFKDVKLWRNHDVSLSDNGQWYTILYRLNEKPMAEKDSLDKKYADEISTEFYDTTNLSDVLYICHANSGIKYETKDGKNPVFSDASDWIAYQIKEDKEPSKDKNAKPEKAIIELKHLTTGFTVKYESNANFSFAEEKNTLSAAIKTDC